MKIDSITLEILNTKVAAASEEMDRIVGRSDAVILIDLVASVVVDL